MITRIVKMTFQPEKVEDFLANFHKNKESIRGFEGCEHLELWRDENQNNVFFTYSWWQGAEYLENYRNSQLFAGVWKYTKSLFSDKPQAWSVKQQVKL